MSCFLSYTSSITGDCSNLNLGAFTINIDGEAPDYTIQWLSPSSGTTSLGAGVTAYTQTNLSAGTYSFNIIDSCGPTNTILPVNIFISNGTCVSVTNIVNTNCDSNNGSLTATTSNFYGDSIFELYNEITGLISTQYPGSNSYVFNNIPSGTYYVIANDGGGCTGKSESVIIKNSSNLSFGLYKVDNAGCAVDSGKIFITGLTGTPPYTYLWSNGSIEDNISGLAEGTYSVTVTDSSNCSISNTTVIYSVSQVGLGALYLTQPSCFTADGEVQIIITGGTPPFYYLGSNGVTNVTFDRTVTFTGLGPGGFTIQVTDAGLCNFTTSTKLLTPKGMSTVSVGVTNSKCNDFSGVIGPINIFGGTSPYTYSLTDSSGKINSETIYSTNWSFDGLSADTYILNITDNGGCTFTSAYTINSQVLFGLTVSTTGTTCDSNDGSVYLEITSGGTPPYIYQINGSVITTTLTSYTFNNLVSGNYTASVTDNTYCKQSTLFTIDNSNTIDFHLLGVDSTNNDGSLTAFITNGTPPFTLYFDGDTVGTTVMTIPDLPPGNYSVRIVDSDGCSQRKSLPISGTKRYDSTGVFTICDAKVLNQPITIQTGPKQLLNEGYSQLILDSPGYTNCVLSEATFQVLVTAGTFSDSSVFYTSYSLLDYPSDEELYAEIQSLLEGSPQIGDVDMNLITNTIVVTTNCDLESLVNTNLNVVIRIDYDIRCVCPPCDIKYDVDTPSPTPTPTYTPTPTMTPTMTPTPTPTRIPLEEFIINAVGVTQIYSTMVYSGFTITSSLTYYINWGDGNIETFLSGTTKINHIYSSPYTPYTGQIKILSTDLTTITSFNSQSNPHNSQSLWTSTIELKKLDGLVSLTCNLTNGLFITGDVNDLPRTLTYLSTSNNNLSGNTSNIPPLLYVMNIQGSNTISGDTSGFTNTLTSALNLYGNNTVSGNVSDLPTSDNIQIYGFNTISGDTSGIPMSTRFQIDGYNTISGDVSNLPSTLVRCTIQGDNTISGNISGFTIPIETIVIDGNNTISGDISDLPLSVIAFRIKGFNTITGDIQYLPPNLIGLTLDNKSLAPNTVSIFGNITTLPSNLTTLVVVSTGAFSGDLSYIPSGVTWFNLYADITFTYTSGRNWASMFIIMDIIPTGSWAGFTSGQTDNILIDIQPKYINTATSVFRIKCGDTPKRSTASNAAFTALVALIGAGDVDLN